MPGYENSGYTSEEKVKAIFTAIDAASTERLFSAFASLLAAGILKQGTIELPFPIEGPDGKLVQSYVTSALEHAVVLKRVIEVLGGRVDHTQGF